MPVTNAGLAIFASLAGNLQTNDIPVYLAFGVGVTPFDNGDVKLADEQYRRRITLRQLVDSELRLRFFMTESDGVGDWTELGVFFGGTDLLDSGTLALREVPPGGCAKSAATTLTQEIRIPITRAVV